MNNAKSPSIANPTIRIVSLAITDTGTYNQQYRRSYATQLTSPLVRDLEERFQGSDTFQPSQFSGIANGLFGIAAPPSGGIVIENGWHTPRCSFVMEVEYEYWTGGKTTEILQGYTNYAGISANGEIDTAMRFIINSTTTARKTVAHTVAGMAPDIAIVDASNIISNPDWKGMYAEETLRCIRPMDAFAGISLSHLEEALTGQISDTRTMLTNIPVKSRCTNGISSHYLSALFTGYAYAQTTTGFCMGEDAILGSARGFVAESLIGKDPIFSALADVNCVPYSNTFHFRDLLQIDPTLSNRSTYVSVDAGQLHVLGETADWGGTDRTTLAAVIINNTVSSLMMENGISKLTLSATNRNIGGGTSVSIAGAISSIGVDLPCYLDRFKICFEQELLGNIFYMEEDFKIDLAFDLFGESRIKISVCGNATMDFCVPSFCSSLMSPVIISDMQRFTETAIDLDVMLNVIFNDATKVSS